MERSRVESSSIAAVGYDAGSRTLEIEFLNGSIYRYFDIAPGFHIAFMAAESKSGFFDARIRDRFDCQQVR